MQTTSEQWRESPRWVPHPTTYINQQRWTDLDAYAPTPPTDAEWREAQRIRALSRRGCPHSLDAPCVEWRACCTKIVQRLRERRRGGA